MEVSGVEAVIMVMIMVLGGDKFIIEIKKTSVKKEVFFMIVLLHQLLFYEALYNDTIICNNLKLVNTFC
jgi:hypothetical protein